MIACNICRHQIYAGQQMLVQRIVGGDDLHFHTDCYRKSDADPRAAAMTAPATSKEREP